MRLRAALVLFTLAGCADKKAQLLSVPEFYPPVRGATPDALIGKSQLASPLLPGSDTAAADSAPTSDEVAPDGGSESTETPPADSNVSASAPLPPGGSATPPPAPGGSAMPPPPPGGSVPPPPPDGSAFAEPVPPGSISGAPMAQQSPGSAAVGSDVAAPMPPGGINPPPEPGAINLATAVQQRFYSGGPTDLLRIIQNIDARLAELQLDPDKHKCLAATPVRSSYELPGHQTFDVALQCLHQRDADWIAFGVDNTTADGSSAGDFYYVEGQARGNGGAYRVDGKTGDIEGWITVADKDAPLNSQVLMHLALDKASGSAELALAGSGVGFCSAHLRTTASALFVRGNMSGPASNGSTASETEFCRPQKSACFDASALMTELPADSSHCAALDGASFRFATELDAVVGGNVTPSALNVIFAMAPSGVPAF